MSNFDSNLSGFDKKAAELLVMLVSGQKMKLEDGEGNTYTSIAKQVDEDTSIATVFKNDKRIAKSIYNYDSSTEELFFF